MYTITQARTIADRIVEQMKPYTERIAIAGSIRRKRPEVKDIEIVYIPRTSQAQALFDLISGWKKIKGDPLGKYTQRKLPEGIHLDLFQVTVDTWGLQFAIRTGPADYSHNVLACTWALKGFHSKGGILYPVISNKEAQSRDDILDYENPRYFKEEQELFSFLGLKYIPPEERK